MEHATQDAGWKLSPLTDWERDLLAMDMSNVPVRSTTTDEDASQQ